MANLPSVTSPLPRDLQQFIQRVREAMDGGGLDGLVTARQMVVAGLASLSGSGNIGSPAGTVVGTPTPPTGLAGSGALASVIVTWNKPTYSGHSYTEIWAATQTAAQVSASEAPIISQAVLVGISAGQVFSHTIGGSATRYYWAKNVNQNGVASAFNATAGVSASTGDDPEYLMSVLSDALNSTSEAPFFQIDVATTINGVEIPAGTYMKAAFIADATITTAKIQDLAVDNAKIDSLDAAKITTGFLDADRIETGTIVAGKINSNGLSIKDVSGNVILAAGSPLGGDLATLNSAVSSMAGAVPAYGSSTASNVSTHTDGSTKLHNGTDTTIGMAYPAFSVNRTTGEVWRITFAVSGDGGASMTGLTVRIYEYDNDLPSGKTHISDNATSSDAVVQEDTRLKTFLYNGNLLGVEDAGLSSSYTTYTLDYTPTSTAEWASLVVLNWSNNSTNAIYVKNVQIGQKNADIANQGAFATEDQINTSNVSTYIGSGAITNAYIGDTIESTSYNAASNTGWQIKKDGTADFNSATLTAGVLQNTAGTFEIDLTNGTITISV